MLAIVQAVHSFNIPSSVLLIYLIDKVTTLGVILDYKLTFDMSLCFVCSLQECTVLFRRPALCRIRSSVADNVATRHLHCSLFDTCSYMYVWTTPVRFWVAISASNIHKHQCCQMSGNTAACLILQQESTQSSQPNRFINIISRRNKAAVSTSTLSVRKSFSHVIEI